MSTPKKPKKAPRKKDVSLESSDTSKALPGPPGGNQTQGKRGAPIGNQNAVKHGLYSKFVPQSILDQAASLMTSDPAERRRWRAAIFEATWLEAISKNAPIEALSRAASVIHTLDDGAAGADGENGPPNRLVLEDCGNG